MITKTDLEQLEQKLIKLINEKLGNTQQVKEELPPFPFWVEITGCSVQTFWYEDKIGKKYQVDSLCNGEASENLKGFYQIINSIALINPLDCKILHNYIPEEHKPIWETHPDWESCKKVRDRFKISKDTTTVHVLGNCGRLLPFSEAHAKRQVAEIKLMEIAEKWNEGVNSIGYVYNVSRIFANLEVITVVYELQEKHLIYFKSKELAQKSIELHKDLWLDYFMISR